MREKKDARVFFALWPDESTRTGLQRICESLPIESLLRPIPIVNLHLTLHFIGNVFFDQLAQMREQARLVKWQPFELTIDQLGYFSKPKVNWLGCKQLPPGLLQLQRTLGEQLKRSGFVPEERSYHPHLSIARDGEVLEPSITFEPQPWFVDRFSLIQVLPIEAGVEYLPVETFSLR